MATSIISNTALSESKRVHLKMQVNNSKIEADVTITNGEVEQVMTGQVVVLNEDNTEQHAGSFWLNAGTNEIGSSIKRELLSVVMPDILEFLTAAKDAE